MRRMTSRTGIAVAIVAAVVGVGAGAALAADPGVITSSGPPSQHDPEARPGEIIYTGDGSGLFAGRGHSIAHPGKIKWTSYGATSAKATAANWLNNCTPSCAGGKFTAYPVTLSLSQAQTVHGRDIFTHMVVSYTGKLPSGVNQHKQTWTVKYKDGAYIWHFPTL
jgi:hypothetical protein